MRRRALASAGLALGLSLAMGCRIADRLAARKQANPVAATPDSLARGAALFASQCQHCHGPEGHGGQVGAIAVPSLVDPERQLRHGSLAWIIENGDDDMPAFGATIPQPRVWDLVNHIGALRARAENP